MANFKFIPKVIQITNQLAYNPRTQVMWQETLALRDDGSIFSYDSVNNRWTELAPVKRASE